MNLKTASKKALLSLCSRELIPHKATDSVVVLRSRIKKFYEQRLETGMEQNLKDFVESHYIIGEGRVIRSTDDLSLLSATGHSTSLVNLFGEPLREYKPFKSNEMRLDFAWPVLKIGIEVQGGIDIPGRKSAHVSRNGMRRDMYKLNLAQTLGWIYFQFPPEVSTELSSWRSYGKKMLTAAFELRWKEMNK